MYKKVSRQVKLSQQVADQIEDLYRNGKLETGKRIPAERELCDQFGVSRTVIREAINILVAKGLLVSMTGSGTYVKEIDSRNVQDMLNLFFTSQNDESIIRYAYEFRAALEVQTARLAASNRTEEDLAALHEIIDGMFSSTDDVKAFTKLDLAFHLQLAKATHNPFFEIFLEPYFTNIHDLIERSNTLPERTLRTAESHRDILASVEAGDVEEAGRRMADSVDAFRDITLRSVSLSGSPGAGGSTARKGP